MPGQHKQQLEDLQKKVETLHELHADKEAALQTVGEYREEVRQVIEEMKAENKKIAQQVDQRLRAIDAAIKTLMQKSTQTALRPFVEQLVRLRNEKAKIVAELVVLDELPPGKKVDIPALSRSFQAATRNVPLIQVTDFLASKGLDNESVPPPTTNLSAVASPESQASGTDWEIRKNSIYFQKKQLRAGMHIELDQEGADGNLFRGIVIVEKIKDGRVFVEGDTQPYTLQELHNFHARIEDIPDTTAAPESRGLQTEEEAFAGFMQDPRAGSTFWFHDGKKQFPFVIKGVQDGRLVAIKKQSRDKVFYTQQDWNEDILAELISDKEPPQPETITKDRASLEAFDGSPHIDSRWTRKKTGQKVPHTLIVKGVTSYGRLALQRQDTSDQEFFTEQEWHDALADRSLIEIKKEQAPPKEEKILVVNDEAALKEFAEEPRKDSQWTVRRNGQRAYTIVIKGIRPDTEQLVVHRFGKPEDEEYIDLADWNHGVVVEKTISRKGEKETPPPKEERVIVINDEATLAEFAGEPKKDAQWTIKKTGQQGYTIVIKGIRPDTNQLVFHRLGKQQDEEYMDLADWDAGVASGTISVKDNKDKAPAPEKIRFVNDETALEDFDGEPTKDSKWGRIKSDGTAHTIEILGINPENGSIVFQKVGTRVMEEMTLLDWDKAIADGDIYVKDEKKPVTEPRIVDDEVALAAFAEQPKKGSKWKNLIDPTNPHTIEILGIDPDSGKIAVKQSGKTEKVYFTKAEWDAAVLATPKLIELMGEPQAAKEKVRPVDDPIALGTFERAPTKKSKWKRMVSPDPGYLVEVLGVIPTATGSEIVVQRLGTDIEERFTRDTWKAAFDSGELVGEKETPTAKKEAPKGIAFAGRRLFVGDIYHAQKAGNTKKRYEIVGINDDGTQLRVKALDMGGALLTFDASTWQDFVLTPEKTTPIEFIGRTFEIGATLKWTSKDKKVLLLTVQGLSENGELLLKSNKGTEVVWDEATLQAFMGKQVADGATLELHGMVDAAVDAAKEQKRNAEIFMVEGKPAKVGEVVTFKSQDGTTASFVVVAIQEQNGQKEIVLQHLESNQEQRILESVWRQNVDQKIYTIERKKSGMEELKELFSATMLNDLYRSLIENPDPRQVEAAFKNIFDGIDGAKKALLELRVKKAGFTSFDQFLQTWQSQLCFMMQEVMQTMANDALSRQIARDSALGSYDQQQELMDQANFGFADRLVRGTKKHLGVLLGSAGAGLSVAGLATTVAAPAALVGGLAFGTTSLVRRVLKRGQLDKKQSARADVVQEADARQRAVFAQTEGTFGQERFAAAMQTMLEGFNSKTNLQFTSKTVHEASLNTLMANEKGKNNIERQTEYRLEKLVANVGRRNAELYPQAYDTNAKSNKIELSRVAARGIANLFSGDLFLNAKGNKRFVGDIFTFVGGALVGGTLAMSSGHILAKTAARLTSGTLRRSVESYYKKGEFAEQAKQDAILKLERALANGKINEATLKALNAKLTTLEKGSPTQSQQTRILEALKAGLPAGIFTAALGLGVDGVRYALPTMDGPHHLDHEINKMTGMKLEDVTAEQPEHVQDSADGRYAGAQDREVVRPVQSRMETAERPVGVGDLQKNLNKFTLAGEDARGKNVLHVANTLQQDATMKALIIEKERIAHPEYTTLNDNQVLHRWRVELAKDAGWDMNSRTYTKTPLFEVNGKQIEFKPFIKDDGTIGITADKEFIKEHGAKSFPEKVLPAETAKHSLGALGEKHGIVKIDSLPPKAVRINGFALERSALFGSTERANEVYIKTIDGKSFLFVKHVDAQGKASVYQFEGAKAKALLSDLNREASLTDMPRQRLEIVNEQQRFAPKSEILKAELDDEGRITKPALPEQFTRGNRTGIAVGKQGAYEYWVTGKQPDAAVYIKTNTGTVMKTTLAELQGEKNKGMDALVSKADAQKVVAATLPDKLDSTNRSGMTNSNGKRAEYWIRPEQGKQVVYIRTDDGKVLKTDMEALRGGNIPKTDAVDLKQEQQLREKQLFENKVTQITTDKALLREMRTRALFQERGADGQKAFDEFAKDYVKKYPTADITDPEEKKDLIRAWKDKVAEIMSKPMMVDRSDVSLLPTADKPIVVLPAVESGKQQISVWNETQRQAQPITLPAAWESKLQDNKLIVPIAETPTAVDVQFRYDPTVKETVPFFRVDAGQAANGTKSYEYYRVADVTNDQYASPVELPEPVQATVPPVIGEQQTEQPVAPVETKPAVPPTEAAPQNQNNVVEFAPQASAQTPIVLERKGDAVTLRSWDAVAKKSIAFDLPDRLVAQMAGGKLQMDLLGTPTTGEIIWSRVNGVRQAVFQVDAGNEYELYPLDLLIKQELVDPVMVPKQGTDTTVVRNAA